MARLASAVHIEGWPPIESATLPLGRFVVLLGRNDSGKTRALQAMAHILSQEPPDEEAPRCGGWVPTLKARKLIRKELSLPEGPMLVLPQDERRPARVRTGGIELELSQELAEKFRRPVGDVVWLRVTDSDFSLGYVRKFLHATLSRLIRSGWDPPGDPDSPEDDDHYVYATAVERGVLTRPCPWVESALSTLGQRAFELLPEFVTRRYLGLEVSVHLELAFETWTGAVHLHSEHRLHSLEDLSSGIRAWVNLAVVEAGRELGHADVQVEGEATVRFGRRETSEPVLYLIDEPERHLHPSAQIDAAMWLMDLVDSRPEVSIFVATHSPAFLDLPLGKASILVCNRDPDEASRHAATITCWSMDDLAQVHLLAELSGFRTSDVFLGGTLPVLVEGKMDRDYLRTAWRMLRSRSPESEGIRMFVTGGVAQAEDIALDLLRRLYPPDTPIVFVTDNLDFDRPSTRDGLTTLIEKCPGLIHLSHDRFDTWALIPEAILAAAGVARTGRWDEIERQRRQILKFHDPTGKQHPLPGKQHVLEEARGKNATEGFARALRELELQGKDFLHPSACRVVEQLVGLAGRRELPAPEGEAAPSRT